MAQQQSQNGFGVQFRPEFPQRGTWGAYSDGVSYNTVGMEKTDVRIYLCFEPEQIFRAKAIDSWPLSNQDLDHYTERTEMPQDGPQAAALKEELQKQIAEAQATICLISQTSIDDGWIAWELTASKRAGNGLVGVLLNELNPYPPAMADGGAIFVPFKKDLIERAVQWSLTEKYTTGDYTLRDF